MRILIIGAGATGGAFGTRLVEAGRDVTFLVRAGRAEALAAEGLHLIAPDGQHSNPVTVTTAEELADAPAFDLVIVAVKAAGIDSAVADIAPAIGPDTLIAPFLNGMAHLDRLEERYPGQVLGGVVKIVGTMQDGAAVQRTEMAGMTIGRLDGSALPQTLTATLDVEGYSFRASGRIVDAMWEKWTFIAAAGLVTCLFRAAIGPIMAAGGGRHVEAMVSELESVAAAAGHPVSARSHEATIGMLTAAGSAFTSSLYRDVIAGLPSEIEHILGDFAARGDALGVDTPLLDLGLVQLRAGELVRTAD